MTVGGGAGGHTPTLVEALRRRAAGPGPGLPFVTMYDERTGERAELSTTTVENWVAKLVNLFRDEWELDDGDLVGVGLPTHWQGLVTVLGAWSAGLAVTFDRSEAVSVAVCGVSSHAWGTATRTLACSLLPFARPVPGDLPSGWYDFAHEVPVQPDLVAMPRSVLPTDPALVASGRAVDHATLVREGLDTAQRLGLEPAGRLATDANPASAVGLSVAVLAPLAVGASVVLIAGATPQRQHQLIAAERATASAVTTD